MGLTGGERVCQAISEALGDPDLFCLLAKPAALPPALARLALTTSFIQRIPLAARYYRSLPFLFPLAVELFDLRQYDLVISSDAAVIKGVITPPETCHVCYCHTPMRYAWSMFHEYRAELTPLQRAVWTPVAHYLRLFDHSASARVDYFVANSRAVQQRIAKYYGRPAVVIHPPCDVERFRPVGGVEDYFLFVGRLVAYKRVDLAVEAFNRNGARLLIAGEGPESRRLKAMAGRNIEFLGRVSEAALPKLYAGCRALIFPGEEDFGIVPVEAQACGRPVIAFAKGGVLETVIPRRTGILFPRQEAAALNQAVEEYNRQAGDFDPGEIRQNAVRFSTDRFRRAFRELVGRCLQEHPTRLSG